MTRRTTRSLLTLCLAAATALLVGGCCDQNCDCQVGVLPGDLGRPEAHGNPSALATGNNSPLLEALTATLTGCAGTFLPQRLSLTDPDGDDMSLDYKVARAPVGASVQIKPEAPVKAKSGDEVEIGVFCDTPGDVRVEYTVTDSYGRVGEGPYVVVYHFHTCPASDGGAAPLDSGASD